MVSPLHILVVGLGAAFFVGLLNHDARRTAFAITLAALAAMTLIAGSWAWAFLFGGATPFTILTAGAPPPFAINLGVAAPEAVLVALVCAVGLLSALTMRDALERFGHRAMAVFLVAVMALVGIILTRDVFNLFVFFELIAIATGGLVLISDDERAVAAGFKYLVASQVVSIAMLIGIIFVYHATASLNLDDMNGGSIGPVDSGPALAFFLLFIALVIELKPFPINGWALDVYQSAHPGFSALFSAGSSTAALWAVDKVIGIGGAPWLPMAAAIGLVTFVGSNLVALSQTDDRRLLGYSSVAQIGLVLTVIGLRDLIGERHLAVGGGILVTHAVAKAGLFWLSGLVASRDLAGWAVLRHRPILIFAFATFVAMLAGLPPFPGFYAKWELVHALAADGRLAFVAAILLGALFEAVYLFRWFGRAIKAPLPEENAAASRITGAVVVATALAGWAIGWTWGAASPYGNVMAATPLLVALAFPLLEWLPARVKNTLAILVLCLGFWVGYPHFDPLQMIFGAIILIGGAVIFIASFTFAQGRRIGFYPSAMLMYAGLTMLIVAPDTFSFFAAWEVLTVGSYFLILRGKESEPHALSYVVFSLGGAFAILAGFALAAQTTAPFALAALKQVAADHAPWVFLLLAVGFMTKTASLGLHIWLPGAHAEAETDVSPMVSGVLLKAGLFGLFMLVMHMGRQSLHGVELTYVMLWIGAGSALIGNVMAAFQEDAKRLLAYSSIGQMGYAVFGIALMNNLGWLMALMFVINHYIYKSSLFLSIGGVAKRTGTREMYRMGGLIKLMPLSFVAVLVSIIAMSGVPPLSGFGGRWIFYNAILDTDARLPMVVIFLSGPIAFLYLFRLIHTIFLGQLKDEHRRVSEAPVWLLVPQMMYVVFLLGFALFPGLALRRVDAFIGGFMPERGLDWEGTTITSAFGHWNPIAIMVVVGVIFVTLFLWLLFLEHRAQMVKQFNIAFAAERPHRPETTHFAWNFFAPYRRAVGVLAEPVFERFWGATTGALHDVAGFVRRLYTGDGQVYALQVVAFVVIVQLIAMGMRP
ncbi:MAG: proton-conducting transporter membrane subunit [Siculibacillus sp.]|nr:proton-conducting transporter membrane subunit [Siculibacillus sp.]